MVSATANNACIILPGFQRYIQAPVLHGKGSNFPMEAPQARHSGQTRLEWYEGEAPSMAISAARTAQEPKDSNRPAPTPLNNDSHWKRRADLPTLSSCNITLFIRKVPAFSGQIQQNQHLQKPQHSPDKKCQPLHWAKVARARWEVGAQGGRGGHQPPQPELLPSFLQTCTTKFSSYCSTNKQRSTAQNYPGQHPNTM